MKEDDNKEKKDVVENDDVSEDAAKEEAEKQQRGFLATFLRIPRKISVGTGRGEERPPMTVNMPDIPTIFIELEGEEAAETAKEVKLQMDENRLQPDEHQDSLSVPGSRPGSRQSGVSSGGLSFVSVASSTMSSWREVSLPQTCTRSLGLLLALVSGVLMTAYSSMIKMLEHMDSMQVVVIRGLLQMLVMGAVAVYKGHSFRSTKERTTAIVLFLVAFTGGLRLIFVFISFSRLPLGDSTTILFSSPVIVMFLSIFILKEPCGLFRVFAALCLMSGVVLVTKPPIVFHREEETYDMLGYSLVLLACILSALGIVLTKFISKKVEKVMILFYLGLASVCCGTIGLFSLGSPGVPEVWEWLVALVIGVLGLLQQYCLVWAVQLESPSRVTIVRQMQIILAYGVQVVLFGVIPSWTDMLGAGLVLGTVVSITFEKNIKECGGELCSKQKHKQKHSGSSDK